MLLTVTLLLFACIVSAQDENGTTPVQEEFIRAPCCTAEQTYNAVCKLFNYAQNGYSSGCNSLYACILKCILNAPFPINCITPTSSHIAFNIWLLSNYHCLPKDKFLCAKKCIIYNSWPPCPEISSPQFASESNIQ